MLTRRATLSALFSCLPLGLANAKDKDAMGSKIAMAPLRDSAVAYPEHKQDIRAAWLHGETDRYRHFVLGGRFEASSISVQDRNGRQFTLELPNDAVFEDRIVRMADLDGDGRTELAVVISRKRVGSALALLGLRDRSLRVLAETSPNGLENRWLNPSGIGRFLGGGERQIAIVRRPHLDAILELHAFDGFRAHLKASVAGYSTHRDGSRHQRLFAVLRGEHGAADRLAVPVGRRDAIAVLDFGRAGNPEIARFPLPGRADGDFRYDSIRRTLFVPLETGETATVSVDLPKA